MITERQPPIMGRLDYGILMNYNPLDFLEDINTTVHIQNCDRGAEWFTTDETSGKNT